MDKKVVSPVCSGFGLGTSCVGCCYGGWGFKDYYGIERLVRVRGNFQESLKVFEKIVQDNTQTLLEFGGDRSLLKNKNLSSYIGLVDGKVGCLLYEKNQETTSLRPRICQKYLCLVAQEDPFFGVLNDGLKKFVHENISSPNFNTLSYSRLISALYHREAESLIGIPDWYEKKKTVLKGLNTLFEIVTRG